MSSRSHTTYYTVKFCDGQDQIVVDEKSLGGPAELEEQVMCPWTNHHSYPGVICQKGSKLECDVVLNALKMPIIVKPAKKRRSSTGVAAQAKGSFMVSLPGAWRLMSLQVILQSMDVIIFVLVVYI